MRASNNLTLRIVSAAILGVVVIWAVVWSTFLLNLLLALGAVIAGAEWTQLVAPHAGKARTPAGRRLTYMESEGARMLLPVVLFVLWIIGTRTHSPQYFAELAGFTALTLLVSLYRGIPVTLWMVAGIPYIGATILSLLALHQGENWHALVFLLIMVWTSDIFAYVFGRLIGGPKLAPRISPNKTWAGSVGGLVAAMIAGAAVCHWLGHGPRGHTMAVAGCIAILTQAGDLAESALKRRFGVKDSGWLIPGHGGILDRIDGLLLAAPFFTIYLLGLGGTI